MPNIIGIGIANCSASQTHVHKGDTVSFISQDNRSYVVTDQDGILQGSAGGIQVPKGPNGNPSPSYKVIGKASTTPHPFPTVGTPDCGKNNKLPPGIIIDN